MVNLLIVDNDISYATTLMNYINERNGNIRVAYIVDDGKKAIDILNSKDNIDIIILDLNIPIYNANEILNNIYNKDKYYNSFIIFSEKINNKKAIYSNELIYSILLKSVNIEKIFGKINELVNYKNNLLSEKYNIRNKIIEEVLYLKYDFSNIGTIYLIDAIKYVITNSIQEFSNLQKEIYPIISKDYGTSINNVKCNITRATQKMYCNCEIDKLEKYFHYYDDIKPDIKTIIRTIVSKITFKIYKKGI